MHPAFFGGIIGWKEKTAKDCDAMIRILIVEDDPNIAKTITATLAVVGYGSDLCENGEEAVRLCAQNSYDLVLLDVMLPGMDGFSVMEQIRYREIPVIFLTAKQNVSDKVQGLRLGAEDYIVKPFEALELLARIEVVLRRFHRNASVLKYGDIAVDLEKHTVQKGGSEVSLTPKEFDILVFFLQNKDVAISRERLLATVWGYEFQGETRTVDIHIQQLRNVAYAHFRFKQNIQNLNAGTVSENLVQFGQIIKQLLVRHLFVHLPDQPFMNVAVLTMWHLCHTITSFHLNNCSNNNMFFSIWQEVL